MSMEVNIGSLEHLDAPMVITDPNKSQLVVKSTTCRIY